jgi:threonine dehydrogenase-like Zn-dependent dehydrogenase
LLVVQVLRAAGAVSIGVIEPSEFRRQVALQVGASAAWAPAAAGPSELASDVGTPTYVFECSGHPTALQTAIAFVAPGGHVRLIGASAAPVPINSMDALLKEVTISANFIYDAEFEVAIRLLAEGAIDVDALTSGVLALDEFDEAFRAMRKSDNAIKLLLTAG